MVECVLGHPLIRVHTTDGNTKSPWDWADEVTHRVVSISPSVSPELRMQAEAFQNDVRRVVAHNIEAALCEERIFLANQAEIFGLSEFATMILARKIAGEKNFHLT